MVFGLTPAFTPTRQRVLLGAAHPHPLLQTLQHPLEGARQRQLRPAFLANPRASPAPSPNRFARRRGHSSTASSGASSPCGQARNASSRHRRWLKTCSHRPKGCSCTRHARPAETRNSSSASLPGCTRASVLSRAGSAHRPPSKPSAGRLTARIRTWPSNREPSAPAAPSPPDPPRQPRPPAPAAQPGHPGGAPAGFRAAAGQSDASKSQGATLTLRAAGGADQGPQLHEGLIKIPGPVRGHQPGGQARQSSPPRAGVDGLLHAIEAGQNPQDVPV